MASLRYFSMLAAVLVAAPVTALMSGCIVDDSDTGPAPGPSYKYPTEQSFCDALAKAECQQQVVEACYGSDSSTLTADTTKCVGVRSNDVKCNPSGFPYNPAAAEPCIAKRKEVYADAELTKAEIEADYEACLPVFSRGGSAGSTCTEDLDCDTGTGLRCLVKIGQTTGSCAVPEVVSGGFKCTGEAQVCADDFYCATNCLARPAENEACSDTIPCLDGLKCASNLCIPKAANGSPCSIGDDCSGGFCIKGTTGTSGTCSSKFTLAITSDTCNDFR